MNDASVKIRGATYARVKGIAEANRNLRIVDTIDLLVDGWDLLTPEQRVQALLGREADRVRQRPPAADAA